MKSKSAAPGPSLPRHLDESTESPWSQAQRWESSWWGNCVNSFHEEEKQLVYAQKMGLVFTRSPKTPYNIDMRGASVLDIGGGPCSLLLKCENVRGKVVDPLTFPDWVYARYDSAGIEWEIKKGEAVDEEGFDEVWLYNVLEHAQAPHRIIAYARRAGKLIRIFEWLDTAPNVGHPHSQTEEWLNKKLGGEGRVEQLRRRGCYGKAYYGVFPARTD